MTDSISTYQDRYGRENCMRLNAGDTKITMPWFNNSRRRSQAGTETVPGIHAANSRLSETTKAPDELICGPKDPGQVAHSR